MTAAEKQAKAIAERLGLPLRSWAVEADKKPGDGAHMAVLELEVDGFGRYVTMTRLAFFDTPLAAANCRAALGLSDGAPP